MIAMASRNVRSFLPGCLWAGLAEAWPGENRGESFVSMSVPAFSASGTLIVPEPGVGTFNTTGEPEAMSRAKARAGRAVIPGPKGLGGGEFLHRHPITA
ncbi:hypothetical protein GCM10009628_21930 [Paeniglutamicibacter kerguelensis]